MVLPRAQKRRLGQHREQSPSRRKRLDGGRSCRQICGLTIGPAECLNLQAASAPESRQSKGNRAGWAVPSRGSPRLIPSFARVSAQRPKRTTQFSRRLRKPLLRSSSSPLRHCREGIPQSTLFNLRPAGVGVNVKQAPQKWRNGDGGATRRWGWRLRVSDAVFEWFAALNGSRAGVLVGRKPAFLLHPLVDTQTAWQDRAAVGGELPRGGPVSTSPVYTTNDNGKLALPAGFQRPTGAGFPDPRKPDRRKSDGFRGDPLCWVWRSTISRVRQLRLAGCPCRPGGDFSSWAPRRSDRPPTDVRPAIDRGQPNRPRQLPVRGCPRAAAQDEARRCRSAVW